MAQQKGVKRAVKVLKRKQKKAEQAKVAGIKRGSRQAEVKQQEEAKDK